MNEKMETDAIIVGASPIGFALMCQLIRYGVDFVIFDKKKHLRFTEKYSEWIDC
jgi:2-polyprenyl-6-methoxyphenol hydroxylase-like FAD-dependent oxidoreductase